MLTFNVVLGYQGLLFRDFLFVFFCFSIRPTDPISGNAFDGMAYYCLPTGMQNSWIVSRKKGDSTSRKLLYELFLLP